MCQNPMSKQEVRDAEARRVGVRIASLDFALDELADAIETLQDRKAAYNIPVQHDARLRAFSMVLALADAIEVSNAMSIQTESLLMSEKLPEDPCTCGDSRPLYSTHWFDCPARI